MNQINQWAKFLAITVLILFGFIALFNSLLANEKPIAAQIQGQWTYPAINDFLADWLPMIERQKMSTDQYEKALYAPIKYSAHTVSTQEEVLLSPSNGRIKYHLLGTDKLGRDTAAGLIRGAYNALRIGLLSTVLASLLGIFLGLIIGYTGDVKIKMNLSQLVLVLIGSILTIFYIIFKFYDNAYLNTVAWFVWIILLLSLYRLMNRFPGQSTIHFPLDTVVMKIVEIRKSIPFLIFLLALLSIYLKPAVSHVIFILWLLTWPVFTRHARAEVILLKEKDFIKTSMAIGVSSWRIMLYHLLPNLLPTLVIVFVFQLSSNILIESTLSYLGIGLPTDEVSWGSMLNEGRKTFNAWWLTFYPGLMLFMMIYSLNILSDKFISIKQS